MIENGDSITRGMGTFRRSPMYGGGDQAYWRTFRESAPPLVWTFLEAKIWQEMLEGRIEGSMQCLDLGSGAAKIAEFLMAIGIKPSNVCGLDLNPNLVNWSRELFPEVKFVVGNCTDVDSFFPPESLDLVVSHMLMNHLTTQDFESTVAAVSRILKPGGKLLYTVPHPYNKAIDFGIDYEKETVVEEDAPWGGKVTYHHRSAQLQEEIVSRYFSEVLGHGYYYTSFESNHAHILSLLAANGVELWRCLRLLIEARV